MVRFVVLFALVGCALQAAPVACVTGTLDQYFNLPEEGCSLSQGVVSVFTNPGVLPGSVEIDPAAISITPLMDSFSGPGFRFTFSASAGAGQVFQSVLEFLLTFPTSRASSASLQSIGTSVAAGGAVVSNAEFCSGMQIECVSTGVALGVFDVGLDAQSLDRQSLGSGGVFTVRVDTVVDGTFGDASLQAVELRFSQVPEPATNVSCLVSVAALLCAKFRRRSENHPWRSK